MFNLEIQPDLAVKKTEKNKELADYALKKGIERVVDELKEVQEKSDDIFFKKLKIDDLSPEALIILKWSVDENERPFPKEVIQNAFKNVKESPMYFDEVTFNDPKDRLNYIKELIVLYPNIFYKKSKN